MFLAWILCLLTGFSLNYVAPVSRATLLKSFLLALACIALAALRYTAGDRLQAARNLATKPGKT